MKHERPDHDDAEARPDDPSGPAPERTAPSGPRAASGDPDAADPAREEGGGPPRSVRPTGTDGGRAEVPHAAHREEGRAGDDVAGEAPEADRANPAPSAPAVERDTAAEGHPAAAEADLATAGAAPAAGPVPPPTPRAGRRTADTSTTETPTGPGSADPPKGRTGRPDPAEEPGAAPEDERRSAGAGPRRRRRPSVVAASVATAVLLIGGGGAYLAGSASAGSAPAGGDADAAARGAGDPPPLTLDGHTVPGRAAQVETDPNGVAPGEPDPNGVVYRADGPLPEGPGSAAVYRAEGETTAEEVARLADALGIDSTPVRRGDSWTAGVVKDGAGPVLRVDVEAPGAWTFHQSVPGTDDCPKGASCAVPPSESVPGAVEPVDEGVAMRAATPVLDAVGQRDAELDAGQVSGAVRTVNADPVVDGLPTYGWTTGVSVDASGEPVGGAGRLKAPAPGDTYPVLGAEETLALMNAAPGVAGATFVVDCATPVPLTEGPREPRTSAACDPGAGVPDRTTITVDEAVFGLAEHSVEGRSALVPSWLFEVRPEGSADSLTVTYPAVDPAHLAAPLPADEPTEEPASASAPRNVEVHGYSATGSELTVRFTGGVCARYAAAAVEGPDEVVVSVTETRKAGQVCILIATEQELTVALEEPLGDRIVVGSDGERIARAESAARLPELSAAG
ncbi:hypothetical protein [Streptomyces sp. WMMC905]|uniref:hypothetical protein n=1 Tax=Streptomyces sp. WMMC905 TaxID=3404123 RepID=UPI003B92665A